MKEPTSQIPHYRAGLGKTLPFGDPYPVPVCKLGWHQGALTQRLQNTAVEIRENFISLSCISAEVGCWSRASSWLCSAKSSVTHWQATCATHNPSPGAVMAACVAASGKEEKRASNLLYKDVHGSCILLLSYPIGQNFITRSHLAAREAGSIHSLWGHSPADGIGQCVYVYMCV